MTSSMLLAARLIDCLGGRSGEHLRLTGDVWNDPAQKLDKFSKIDEVHKGATMTPKALRLL